MTELPDPAEQIAQLFPKRRVRMIVEADLDPIPGWGHEAEDWRAMIQRELDSIAGHYHPTVTIEETA